MSNRNCARNPIRKNTNERIVIEMIHVLNKDIVLNVIRTVPGTSSIRTRTTGGDTIPLQFLANRADLKRRKLNRK